MNKLEYIWRYELRDWIEGGVMAFYAFTFGIGPAILGFCAGRWFPLWLRLVPLLFILPAGAWWVMHSDHFFSIYLLGNTLYATGVVVGLLRRAKKQEERFWGYAHVDWMTIAGGTIIMALMYVRPSA